MPRPHPAAIARLLLATLLAAALAGARAEPDPMLAIVIDDLGWNLEAGRRTLALPGALTVAVLPGTPVGRELAATARERGRQVILHQPMASMQPVRLGPAALVPEMDETLLRATVAANLSALPGHSGISNHMGSLLTSREQPMRWLMEELASRDIFFLDSRTTPDTVAQRTANEYGIPALRRDVFLDVVIDTQQIRMALGQAARLAQRRGYAIAIGHPHPETLAVLETELPRLQGELRLVRLSDILHRQRTRALRASVAQ